MRIPTPPARSYGAGPGAIATALLPARPGRGRIDFRRAAAATRLSAALASVLAGVLPGMCAAASRPGLQAEIEFAAKRPAVVVVLVDGASVSGKFHGFVGDWRDTVDSAIRYEAWRQAQPEGVPRLGQPMRVVLLTGDSLRGSFMGVSGTSLAISSANSRYDLPIAFEAIADAGSADGAPLDAWPGLRDRLLGAPSLVGLGLQHGNETLLVPRERIASIRGAGLSQTEYTMIVGAALVGILVCVVIKQSADDTKSSSSSGNSDAFKEFFGFFCGQSLIVGPGGDARFGASDVTHGLEAWAPGETRRP